MKKFVVLTLAVLMLAFWVIPAFAQPNGETPNRLVLGMVPSRGVDKLVDN